MTNTNGRPPGVFERKRLKLAALAQQRQSRGAARMSRLSAVARRRQAEGAGDLWCILRTSPGRTIALAKSLSDAGIKTWTPQQTITRRRPRSNATVDREIALAPTFVFADADRLAELARVQASPVSPHPVFSIFHDAGLVPLVSDEEVGGFRAAEGKARKERERLERAKLAPPIFASGASVQTTEEPAFIGLTGKVEEQRGRAVRISFGGLLTIQVDAWQLMPAAL
jgi:hypothetical protein